MTTYNHRPLDADDLKATHVASHRSTTSSRRPGVAIEGTVRRELVQLARCPDCPGHPKRFGTGPHAPRWVVRDGRHVKVDCAGREIPNAAPTPKET
jgi:hypothetical protein